MLLGPAGNMDGQQNLFVPVLPAALGVHPRRTHEGHPTVQGVEKQPHVLYHKDPAGPPDRGSRGGGVEEPVHQGLGLGHGELLL